MTFPLASCVALVADAELPDILFFKVAKTDALVV